MFARRQVAARVAGMVALVLVAGCSDTQPQDADQREGPTSPSASPAEGESALEEPGTVVDTYADVEDPASRPMAVELVPGLAAVSAWKGSDVDDRTAPISAELFLSPGRSVTFLVNSFDGLLARPTSESELRAWRRDNVFTQGPTEVMDRVVVGGIEMLHARGEGPLGTVDWFVHAFGELTVEVLFTMPADLSEEQRETYVAQVMATLELADG